jgi:hypothetical protein
MRPSRRSAKSTDIGLSVAECKFARYECETKLGEARTANARTLPGEVPSGTVAVSASTRADIANQISLAEQAENELLR